MTDADQEFINALPDLRLDAAATEFLVLMLPRAMLLLDRQNQLLALAEELS